MSWTLKTATNEKTLADWGLGAASVRRQNQDYDSATFAAPALAFDADPLFAVGDVLELWRDLAADFTGGTRVFVGEVVSVPAYADAASEGQGYELRNAWSALDELMYEQQWFFPDPEALEILVGGRQSHVVLFQGFNGSKLTLGEQLGDIITVATGAGVALQVSAGDLAALTLKPPYDEARDITCAEALRKCLRWIPDAVSWVDYTTTPPTLRIQRRAALNTVTLPCVTTDDYLVESVELRARPDLVAPAVVLKYERVNSVDGVPVRKLVKDVFPLGADEEQRGNLIATIDLEGDAVQELSATITTRPFRPTTWGWWSFHLSNEWEFGGAFEVTALTARFDEEVDSPAFSDTHLVALNPTDGSGLVGLPNELATGEIAPWMLGSEGRAESVVVSAVLNHTGNFLGDQVNSKQVRARVTLTSLTSGTFTTTNLLSAGEDVPVGLAEQLYAAVSVLQHEGRIGLVAQECPAVGFGRLNLTGGRAEWATMGALIQSVDYDIGSGSTQVTFGPPAHLGPTDLVELVRFNRQRRLTAAFTGRVEGRAAGRGALGSFNANHDSHVSVETLQRSAIKAMHIDGEDVRRIDADASQLYSLAQGASDSTARFLPVTVKIGGVDKEVLVLGQVVPV